MNAHSMYRGPLARPVPALLLQLAAIGACFAFGVPVFQHRIAPAVAGEVLGGFALWTLFEYAFHRWVMHAPYKKVWEVLHQQHHQMRRMADPEHRLLHPLVATALYGGLFLVVRRAAGPVALGFWFGYLVYEFIHWAHHDARLITWLSRFRYFRRREANHRDHHFRNPKGNFGFTTQLWDRVFGTAMDLPAPRAS